jgi:hypothetical protein
VTHRCPAVQGECGLRRSQNPYTEGHPLDASLPRLYCRLRRSELGVVRGSGTGPCREDAHRLLMRCFRRPRGGSTRRCGSTSSARGSSKLLWTPAQRQRPPSSTARSGPAPSGGFAGSTDPLPAHFSRKSRPAFGKVDTRPSAHPLRGAGSATAVDDGPRSPTLRRRGPEEPRLAHLELPANQRGDADGVPGGTPAFFLHGPVPGSWTVPG